MFTFWICVSLFFFFIFVAILICRGEWVANNREFCIKLVEEGNQNKKKKTETIDFFLVREGSINTPCVYMIVVLHNSMLLLWFFPYISINRFYKLCMCVPADVCYYKNMFLCIYCFGFLVFFFFSFCIHFFIDNKQTNKKWIEEKADWEQMTATFLRNFFFFSIFLDISFALMKNKLVWACVTFSVWN